MNYAQEIKDKINMRDVLSFYGIFRGYGNRIPCPIHDGKNKNFAFKDGSYRCFKCGASGDVISFVQEYFGLDFNSAIKKLNDDFSLGLPIGKKVNRRQALANAKRSFDRKQKIKAERKTAEQLQAEYDRACDKFAEYDKNIIKYKPATEDEEWHPLFVEAVQNRNIAEQEMRIAEMRLYDYEHRNSSNS